MSRFFISLVSVALLIGSAARSAGSAIARAIAPVFYDAFPAPEPPLEVFAERAPSVTGLAAARAFLGRQLERVERRHGRAPLSVALVGT